MNFKEPNRNLVFSRFGQDADGRMVRTASVVSDDPSDDIINLKSFLEYLNKVMDAIPEQYRADAVIVLGREDWEYGTMAEFEIYVREYETQDAKLAREAKETEENRLAAIKAKEEQEKRERATYEKLKAKYEWRRLLKPC